MKEYLELFKKSPYRLGLFASLGALFGFGYYFFIGCNTGSCAITGSPYVSTAYGMVVGAVLGYGGKESESKADDQQETTEE